MGVGSVGVRCVVLGGATGYIHLTQCPTHCRATLSWRCGPVCACTRVCWCRRIFTYIHTYSYTILYPRAFFVSKHSRFSLLGWPGPGHGPAAETGEQQQASQQSTTEIEHVKHTHTPHHPATKPWRPARALARPRGGALHRLKTVLFYLRLNAFTKWFKCVGL